MIPRYDKMGQLTLGERLSMHVEKGAKEFEALSLELKDRVSEADYAKMQGIYEALNYMSGNLKSDSLYGEIMQKTIWSHGIGIRNIAEAYKSVKKGGWIYDDFITAKGILEEIVNMMIKTRIKHDPTFISPSAASPRTSSLALTCRPCCP